MPDAEIALVCAAWYNIFSEVLAENIFFLAVVQACTTSLLPFLIRKYFLIPSQKFLSKSNTDLD
jgi:hypothetical protein